MRRFALLALAGTVFAGNAFAGTITGNNFVVTAKVDPSCVVTGDTDIDFGTYDPAVANFGTNDTASGSISVRCTKGTNISIGIEQGQNALAGGACSATPARRMKEAASANFINYNILQSSGGATWGCGGTSEATRTAGASNTIETFTTFGVIPAAQDVPAGTYSDTVNYIVTF